MVKTDILIVHLNGEQIIRNCLNSIYKNTKDFEIYLLFNNSRDKSKEIVEKEFPKVKIFSSNKTLGFAEASNFLAKKSLSKQIVFLNNDTEVARNWLSSMLKTLKRHKNCVAVQPKVKSYFNRENFEYAGAAGGFIDKFGYPFCRGRIFNTVEKDHGQYDSETRIFWGSGVCLLVNKEFFLKSGAFDTDFFMYAEELDFCWRANIYGKEIWYSPDSSVYHIGSFTIKREKLNVKKEYLITRNHLLLILKNHSIKTLLVVLPVRILLEVVSSIRFFPKKTFSFTLSLLNLPFLITKIIKKRREIQKKRNTSDKDLSGLITSKSIALLYFLEGKKYFKEILLSW